MSECASFATPLHEAIHQLCYNKGLFSRMAPIPKWVSEGIACSFEGAGTRSRANPQHLNIEQSVQLARDLDRRPRGLPGAPWTQMVSTDSAFRSPESLAFAYANSWSLHWYLVNEYPEPLAEYMKYIQTLQPLQDVSDAARLSKFHDYFDVEPNALMDPFRQYFTEIASKNRKVRKELKEDGVTQLNRNLASVSMYAGTDGRQLQANGQLRNISPFRDMAYFVRLETNSGQYLNWFLPSVPMGKAAKLQRQTLNGGGAQFGVDVWSALVGSAEASQWAAGVPPDIQSLGRP